MIITTAFKIVKTKMTKKDMYCNIKIKINGIELETIAMIDSGNMLKEPITGTPVIVVESTLLEEALPREILNNLEKLIEKCIEKTKYIVISESNKTKPTVEELSYMLSNYGKVKIFSKEHQYKVTGSENKNKTIEMLIVLKVKESS